MQAFTKTYKSGTHLFHENDHSRELYIIQSGSIRVYRKIGSRDVDLARLSKGAVLGEMALIDGKPRSASAVAGEDTTVIIIDADTFHKRIAGVPPWFLSMIKTTSEKIRKANTRLEAIQSRGLCHHVVIALQYQFLRYGAVPDGDARKALDVSQTATRLVQLMSVNNQCVMQVLAALQKKGVIDLPDGRIVLCDQAKLDGCCDYLRLSFKKSFDKLGTMSVATANVIMALSETVAGSNAASDKGVEIVGPDVAAACAKCNAGASTLECAAEMRDLELCTFTKATSPSKEGNASASPKGGDDAPLAGYQFVLDPAAYKKALIYCTYKDMVPSL